MRFTIGMRYIFHPNWGEFLPAWWKSWDTRWRDIILGIYCGLFVVWCCYMAFQSGYIQGYYIAHGYKPPPTFIFRMLNF